MIHISTILEVCTKETFNLIHSGYSSRVREMYAFITTGCPNLQTKKKKNEKWKQNKTTNMLRIVSIIRHRAADTTRKMQMRLVISLILFLSFCCVLCRFFFFFSLSLSLFWSEGVVVPSCGLHTLHVRIQLGNMQIRIVSPEEMRLNSTHGRCLSFFKIFSSCVDFVYSLTLFFHRHKSTGDIHFVLCFPSISLSF